MPASKVTKPKREQKYIAFMNVSWSNLLLLCQHELLKLTGMSRDFRENTASYCQKFCGEFRGFWSVTPFSTWTLTRYRQTELFSASLCQQWPAMHFHWPEFLLSKACQSNKITWWFWDPDIYIDKGINGDYYQANLMCTINQKWKLLSRGVKKDLVH